RSLLADHSGRDAPAAARFALLPGRAAAVPRSLRNVALADRAVRVAARRRLRGGRILILDGDDRVDPLPAYRGDRALAPGALPPRAPGRSREAPPRCRRICGRSRALATLGPPRDRRLGGGLHGAVVRGAFGPRRTAPHRRDPAARRPGRARGARVDRFLDD